MDKRISRRVGDVYAHGPSVEAPQELYLVAQVDYGKVALIGITTGGNRWTDPVEIVHHDEITEAEWAKITGNQWEEFHLWEVRDEAVNVLRSLMSSYTVSRHTGLVVFTLRQPLCRSRREALPPHR